MGTEIFIIPTEGVSDLKRLHSLPVSLAAARRAEEVKESCCVLSRHPWPHH